MFEQGGDGANILLRLKQLFVRNFRSIREHTFDLPSLTILVGRNDVGKSNILDAITYLLEGTGKNITVKEFYDPAQPIEIAGVFQGAQNYLDRCDQRNRTRIQQRINDDDEITIRRIAQAPSESTKIEIRSLASGEFDTPTGIDAALRRLLPEVIKIEALADVSEETKNTQKDALGKIMRQVLSAIEDRIQPQVEEAYHQVNTALNVQRVQIEGGIQYQDNRVQELRAVETQITGYLRETFPAAGIRLDVGLPTVKEILGKIDLLVVEGTQEDPYYRRGHGLQRVLYLSLLRALADRIRESEESPIKRPFILLFEEPEAFLHPEAQIKMRNALSAISGEAQVVLATHSPIIVTADAIGNTVRVKKVQEAGIAKPFTKGWGPVNPDELQAPERQMLQLFALQRSSKFLFANGVLLVEGVGDEHLIAAIAKRLADIDFEELDICLVECGGKAKIVHFMRVLQRMGLKTWAIVDLDYLWDGAGELIGTEVQYARFGQELNRLVPRENRGALTDAERRDVKRRRKEACIGPLSAQRDALCNLLAQRHGVFVLRNGEIEDYVGLGQRSKGEYLPAAREIVSGDREVQNQPELVQILDTFRT